MVPDYSISQKTITLGELQTKGLHTDTLVITDIHLGAEYALPQLALEVLNNIDFKILVLGGDTFQDEEESKIKFSDIDELVASKIKELSKSREVVVLAGNHDEDIDLEILKDKLGVEFMSQSWLQNKVLVVHGHQGSGKPRDGSVTREIADLGDRIFRVFGLKHLFDVLGNIIYQLPRKVRENAIFYGHKYEAEVVISGHTHQSELRKVGQLTYINTGGFASQCHGFVVINSSEIILYKLRV